MAQQQRHYTANVPVPSKLDIHGQLENSWKSFKRQWQNYSIASRLDREENSYQCAVLLACIGEDALEIFDGLPFANEQEKKNVDTVLQKFEEFCIGAPCEVYETYKFHQRQQETSEGIDTYVAALRQAAKSCNFAEEERMIRDRVVMGIKDDTIRKKLLEEKELTLQKAVRICRAHETAQTQMQSMAGEQVNRVHDRRPRGKQKGQTYPRKERLQPPPHRQDRKPQAQSAKSCPRCGRGPHSRDACPAKGEKCRKCGKTGHYAALCRSTASVHLAEQEEEEAFLGSLTIGEVSDAWKAPIQVDKQPTYDFKLDTGADVTVIPLKLVPPSRLPLQHTAKRLFGPGRTKITVLGKFTAELSCKGRSANQDVYVIQDLEEPLLGRPAISALRLLEQINAVNDKEASLRQEFPSLFSSLGKLNGVSYKIQLKNDRTPFAVSAPRRLALPLHGKVKEELDKLQKLGVIRPVSNPTDWCAPIVVVPKSNGKIRLCIDFTKLNEAVKRENFPLPQTDQLLAQLAGSTTFTKLDCNSGFHQLPLHPESEELTTFITPFGRFCYTRLPFGISSGPEIFQRTMSHLLADVRGVICDMDDLLIHGSSQEEHDNRLREVMTKLSDAGLSLNPEKCEYSQSNIKFLGHIVSAEGIKIDPEKVAAISSFPRPSNITELRRLLGMVNHVAKFAGPSLADNTRALRDLLKKDTEWTWDAPQEEAYLHIKQQLTSAPVLAHYSPNRKTRLSTDASSYGLGAVLLQKQDDGNFRPVFYTSRSLTPTEQRYAQVEKEALGVTWACEKFSEFITGLKDLTVETDHKPLLALLKTKNLDELSPRLLRFRMRLMRYSYQIEYTRGKNLVVADALSRAPVCTADENDRRLEEDTQAFIQLVISNIPATDMRLDQIRQELKQDQVCIKLMKYAQEGWPDTCPEDQLKPYWAVRQNISLHQDLLLCGTRLIIPEKLKAEMLQRLHTGHQGIVKCRARAKESIWWPGLSTQIETMVERCPVCVRERPIPPEPLLPTQTPDYPWQRIGMDLMELRKETYLVVVDYYSRFIELAFLKNTSAETVINHCKSIFSRHGIPEVVKTDNGPQFASRQFSVFAEKYGFQHSTSSPYYPQANGEAERSVKTVKALLKKADDPYLALLSYRATPLQHGSSPAELLMGRKLRTTLPTLQSKLQSHGSDLKFKERDMELKRKIKLHFDKSHRAKPAPQLIPGQPVWVEPQGSPGTVIKHLGHRSYEVATPSGKQRRNSRSLIPRDLKPHAPAAPPKDASSLVPKYTHNPDSPDPAPFEAAAVPYGNQPASQNNPQSAPAKTTRSGRIIRQPERLDL